MAMFRLPWECNDFQLSVHVRAISSIQVAMFSNSICGVDWASETISSDQNIETGNIICFWGSRPQELDLSRYITNIWFCKSPQFFSVLLPVLR